MKKRWAGFKESVSVQTECCFLQTDIIVIIIIIKEKERENEE